MPSAAPILIVDDDAVSRRVLAQTLADAGLAAESVPSAAAALERLAAERPALVLLDLLMPDADGYHVLEQIRASEALRGLPVVVLTALDDDDEIQRVFASGADDYVKKPFRATELIARIEQQLRIRDYVTRLSRRERDAQTMLELTRTLASSLDIRDILYTVVRRIADLVQVDRCSIVLVGETLNTGFVVATSDDEHLRDLPIDLARYPEIREVLATERGLVIEDAARHPLLAELRQSDPKPAFVSLALVPLVHEARALGVVFMRSRRTVAIAEEEVSLAQTVANATAMALHNARLMQHMKDETQQSRFARVEAERRVQLFRRYADFFESAADGMIVVDGQGRILFANPRAREISGYDEAALLALGLDTLFAESEQPRVAALSRGFRAGVYPRDVDLAATRSDGARITLSVGFSSVLHEDDAVLCSFRDVTHERATAIELKQTKEFLERVIASSVDGIVSADLKGRVTLFNRAAERLFGYPATEVVGKLHVDKLYPPGVAREIMRKIRDPEIDGAGRLEDYRVDMVGASGEFIQVTLSAALIVDDGVPLGSVGIFTDVRERLRMESRLARTQEELRVRERQAIVAELAGAAAHELNQPLTSVIGYAELLRRQLKDEPSLTNAAHVIISEAERMAEIVRKVGKITRYETKSYVGDQKILDLERASDDGGTNR